MTLTEQTNLSLYGESLPSLAEIETISNYANSSEINKIEFAQEAKKQIADGKKLAGGIALYLVGLTNESVQTLETCRETQEKWLFLSKGYKKLKDFDHAINCLVDAEKNGVDSLSVSLSKTSVLIAASKFEEAQDEINKCSNFNGVSANYHYHLGRLANAKGEYQEAVDNFEAAIKLDDNHAEAKFQLAYTLDLRGDEDIAMEYYLELASKVPTKAAVLLNIAVLFEDKGEFNRAYEYVKLVLDSFPNHAWAKMFAKDLENSLTMFFDEEHEKKQDMQNQTLETPISDFELSVRSRNCLRKMNIHTVGDLLRINESELLSYKNFGETSLNEIRAILDSKNLRLGMNFDDASAPVDSSASGENGSDSEADTRTVKELELSVRANRALERLNIRTFAELTSKTEAELLGCKNFGITSLTEIKEKLTKYGISLRKLE